MNIVIGRMLARKLVWNSRIRSMLRRSMAAMCEEETPELREEIMKDYVALCAAEIAMEKLSIKHGIWQSGRVLPTKTWQCSACKGVVQTGNYCYKCYYDYCPNCGAKNRR